MATIISIIQGISSMASFVKHPLIKPESIEARLYQELLVARVAEKGNTLIVAPTALGKTVIAVMLAAHKLQENPEAKILFLAPTKPLAVQHHKSFIKFMNMNEAEVAVLTGTLNSKEREEVWKKSKIITATPQAIENDIITGKISLKDVGLIIFDEAHRAVKDYSYVFVANNYIKQANKPSILALTASPGSSEEKIQDVCRNLFIQNVEIKTAKDEDVKEYTNDIEFQFEVVELPPQFLKIKRELEIFMKEQLLFLKKLGFAHSINSKFFGKRQLIELQASIRKNLVQKAKEQPQVFLAVSRVATLLKISHAHTLLETQGIPSLNDYFNKLKSESDAKSSKAVSFIMKHESIQEAIEITKELARQGIDHPKLDRLKQILQKQFAANPESRVLVFNHYRGSIRYLEKFLSNQEGIKVKRFVGQADKGDDKGLSQKEQMLILDEFREGKYNTLICSSVAEEGLDIPAVDLVVFYETTPSEIRHIQRRGRTGRFGKGKVVLMIAKGTRDEAFYYVSQNKERQMHRTLTSMKHDSGALPKQQTLLKFINEVKDQILIYADHREQASSVTKTLIDMGAMVKVKQLEIGDFIISDDVVIERKTVDDFLSSMLDGRLMGQLIKMKENYASPLILVEGNQEDLFVMRNIHRNAIIGMLTSIALNYKVPVLFTRDANETADFIFVTAKREQLGSDKDIRLRVGRKGLTLNEQQRFVVESLPMIGPTMAKSLLNNFGSIKAIVDASEDELQEVEKMGPKKAKQILNVFRAKYEEEER
jgi:Fanconi anemia group M protein